jgi:MYXO-CTERM domain-containing protein
MIAGALMLGPAFAQTPSGGNPPAPSSGAATSGQTVPGTDMNSPSRNDDRDHNFNFGWLGLIGLAGLLGLRRPNRYDNPRNIDNTGPGGIR